MSYNRHYCYSIVFEDGSTYFGVRTCRCPIAADSYNGSPTTYAAKWQTDMPKIKQIVSVHATRRLANEAEAKLILDFWQVSKTLSLNASIRGAKFCRRDCKHTADAKAKMSKSSTGKTHTAETMAKLSRARKGKTHTARTKSKISEAHKGKAKSDKHKAKLAEVKKGRANTSLAARNSLEIACPVCAFVGKGTGNMRRHHFANCKLLQLAH